jgi:predicted TIM-barrel fold metal-dependent hydrolase
MSACADLIFSGVFSRFPRLKVVMSEAGAAWVPYLLERMDYTWERIRLQDKPKEPPSRLFARHFWTCLIKDALAIELRHSIGVERLMLETDFPHQDSNWPHSRKVFSEMLAAVPDHEVRRIAELNAREVFKV